MEFERVWLELHDQGLLDFVVWGAEQTREEESITNADMWILGANIVPSLVRGMGPLNKLQAIVVLRNFVLNGRVVSINVLAMRTGNVARLGEALSAGHMPLNGNVMHRYWGFWVSCFGGAGIWGIRFGGVMAASQQK